MRLTKGSQARATTGLNVRATAGGVIVATLRAGVLMTLLENVPASGWVRIEAHGWTKDGKTLYFEPDVASGVKITKRSGWRFQTVTGFVASGYLAVVDGPVR